MVYEVYEEVEVVEVYEKVLGSRIRGLIKRGNKRDEERRDRCKNIKI